MLGKTLSVSPQTHRRLQHNRVAALGSAVLAVFASALPVAAQTWNSNTGGNWNTAANWLSNATPPAPIIPASGNTTALIFTATGGTGNLGTVNNIGVNNSAFTLNSLTFRNNMADYAANPYRGISVGTTGGRSLSFAGTTPTVTLNGTGAVASFTHNMDQSLAFNANTTFSLTNTGNTGAVLQIAGATTNTFATNGNTVTFNANAGGAGGGGGLGVNLRQTLSGANNIVMLGGAGSTTNTGFGGGATLNVNGSTSFAGGASANVTLQGGVSNTGRGGNATLAWGGTTSFTPTVTFVAGGAPVGVNSSTKAINVNGYNATVLGLSSADTSSTYIVRNQATTGGMIGALTINNTADFTYGGQIVNGTAGTLRLVKSGAGTQTFTGTSVTNEIAYTGTTTVDAGTLTFATTASNILAGPVSVTGGTLNLGSSAGTLTASGGVTVSGGSLNVLSGATVTGLTQSAGTTTINGTGSVTGAVNVTGGTVQGTGTLPAFSLNSGVVLSPGNSIGIINGTSLTFNGGGAIAFELDQITPASDLVALSGALTKGSPGLYTFNFGSTTLNQANVFTLATFASTDFAASDFSVTGLASGPGFDYDLVVNPTNIQLVASAAVVVPESGTGALAALGLLAVIFVPVVRRARKSRA